MGIPNYIALVTVLECGNCVLFLNHDTIEETCDLTVLKILRAPNAS